MSMRNLDKEIRGHFELVQDIHITFDHCQGTSKYPWVLVREWAYTCHHGADLPSANDPGDCAKANGTSVASTVASRERWLNTTRRSEAKKRNCHITRHKWTAPNPYSMSSFKFFCWVLEWSINACSVDICEQRYRWWSEEIDQEGDGNWWSFQWSWPLESERPPSSFKRKLLPMTNLWKVSIPDCGGVNENVIKQMLGYEKPLCPTSELSSLFLHPLPRYHIHIVARRPTGEWLLMWLILFANSTDDVYPVIRKCSRSPSTEVDDCVAKRKEISEYRVYREGPIRWPIGKFGRCWYYRSELMGFNFRCTKGGTSNTFHSTS